MIRVGFGAALWPRRQDRKIGIAESSPPLTFRPAVARRMFLVPLLAFALFSGCSSNNEQAPPPPPGVTVAHVLQKDVPVYQEWVGSMLGNTDAQIRPKVDGFLLEQIYREGSYVKKGDTLFKIDPRQAQAAVEQATAELERARAALAQAQIDVRRYTPLVAQKAVSQAELDKALSEERASKAQVDASQANLDNAKLNLTWTTVTSPISGIAGVAVVNVGDLMTPITPMTTVSNVDPIYVDFNIAEQDYLRFNRDRTGQAAGRSLELFLGDGTLFPHEGHALLINREVDLRTGTILVRAGFPNPGNVLRPGQYARIRAVSENRKNALLIPQQAVTEIQGTYQVGVVDAENKVSIRTIKLGPQVGDMWVVNDGLKAGESVVVDGLQRIKNGMTVAPSPFKDTQANAVAGEK
jgi:membrane fusion protein, multidrug efflux system